jgi:hypothetical protein
MFNYFLWYSVHILVFLSLEEKESTLFIRLVIDLIRVVSAGFLLLLEGFSQVEFKREGQINLVRLIINFR